MFNARLANFTTLTSWCIFVSTTSIEGDKYAFRSVLYGWLLRRRLQ